MEHKAKRILDSAAELLIEFGYDKTTVDDIAKRAGISKGSIYSYFESKDKLLEALLVRELTRYHERWMELIDQDPDGGTLAGMYRNVLVALMDNEFVSSMFRRDTRMLGSYLRKPNSFFRTQDQSMRFEFVKMMQDAGAIRADVDAKATAHIMNLLTYGLVSIQEVMTPENIPPTEDVINGIAAMMERAFTPEDGGNREAGKLILKAMTDASRQTDSATSDSEPGA